MSKNSEGPRTDRPNLQQKRKLAKELLKAVRRLDNGSAARFTWNHPRFRGKSASDVLREGVTLSDAQHVIASESGFESWPKLKEYVEALEREPEGAAAVFESAVRAIIRGDAQRLRQLLEASPEVATMRSTRRHRCVLPHYVAANGVENEHQIVPNNAPEMARILFAAGANAVVDATAPIYGGGPGSTPLVALVSSVHPHLAGVQRELVQIFCEWGANADGIEGDGLPMAVALGFRYPAAASALAECGASIDNLPVAAGVGRIDLVEDYLNEQLHLASEACHFPNPKHEVFPRSFAPHPAATLQQALVFACMSGHVAIAKMLLERNVDPAGGPRRGITALHEACYQGQAEAAHLLLEYGADPTQRDQMWHSTAIGWADGGKQHRLIDWLFENPRVDFLDAVELRNYSVARRLLTADPLLANGPNGSGGPLRYVAGKGDLRMAKLLLEFGADPMQKGEDGYSALDVAGLNSNRELTDLLRLSAGQDQGDK